MNKILTSLKVFAVCIFFGHSPAMALNESPEIRREFELQEEFLRLNNEFFFHLTSEANVPQALKTLRALDKHCEENNATWIAGNYKNKILFFEKLVKSPEHKKISLIDAYAKFKNGAELYSQGDYLNAANLLVDSHNTLKSEFDGIHMEQLNCLILLAQINKLHGHLDHALKLSNFASDLTEKSFGSEHPFFADSISVSAYLYLLNDDLKQSEKLLTKAISIRKSLSGRFEYKHQLALTNLARLALQKKDYSSAGELLKKSEELCPVTMSSNFQKSLLKVAFLQSQYLLAIKDYQNSLEYLEYLILNESNIPLEEISDRIEMLESYKRCLNEIFPDQSTLEIENRVQKLRLTQSQRIGTLPPIIIIDGKLSFGN